MKLKLTLHLIARINANANYCFNLTPSPNEIRLQKFNVAVISTFNSIPSYL